MRFWHVLAYVLLSHLVCGHFANKFVPVLEVRWGKLPTQVWGRTGRKPLVYLIDFPDDTLIHGKSIAGLCGTVLAQTPNASRAVV
jgi:hypothetical protein